MASALVERVSAEAAGVRNPVTERSATEGNFYRPKQAVRPSNRAANAPCDFPGTVEMDAEERERLLLEHLPQVQYIARRIHERLPAHVPLEDLVNAGVIGLIEALERFDPSRNVQLKSFAKFRIRGAILDSIRALDWGSRHLRRQGRRIEGAIAKLRAELQRAPSIAEISEKLQVGVAELQHLLGEIRGLRLGSLDDLSDEQGSNANDVAQYRPHDGESDPFLLHLRSEMKTLMFRAIERLEGNERKVLALYYAEEMKMKDVGAMLGVSESRVSQIHSAALLRVRAKVREAMRPGEAVEARKDFSGPRIEQMENVLH